MKYYYSYTNYTRQYSVNYRLTCFVLELTRNVSRLPWWFVWCFRGRGVVPMQLSPRGTSVVNGRGRGSAGSRGAGGISRGYVPRNTFKTGTNASEVCVGLTEYLTFWALFEKKKNELQNLKLLSYFGLVEFTEFNRNRSSRHSSLK